MPRSAYLLVSHGSRDPRPQAAMDHLAQLFAQQLTQLQPHQVARPLVETAVLELAPQPLHQQIQTFADRVIRAGYEQIDVLPIFLLPGVHVMEDIPAELALAQQHLQGKLTLIQHSHLGTQPLGPLLLNSLEPAVAASGTAHGTARILMSHGSRRADSLQSVAAIATQLGASAAYWSVPPSLETQITALVEQGHQQIDILPYFLFEGGITDAIGRAVNQLSPQFPTVKLNLVKPLGATPELAHWVIQLLQLKTATETSVLH